MRVFVLFGSFGVGGLLPSIGAARAQDARQVRQPRIPPACVVLDAKIAGRGTSIGSETQSGVGAVQVVDL